jgi:hypothetical protein
MKSQVIERSPKPLEAIGQLGGHVKTGIATPRGERTGARMALLSALPLTPDSDQMVVTFLDRSSPVDSFDYKAASGDNAVLILPRSALGLSIVKGVCPGDWRGCKVQYGVELEEPVDLDVDPTGLDLAASDAWVDLVDEIGCDCSKQGGYPVWTSSPVDVEAVMGRPMRFHHRLCSEVMDFGLGEGYVVYVFVSEDATCGCVLYQRSGGGKERTYSMWDGR